MLLTSAGPHYSKSQMAFTSSQHHSFDKHHWIPTLCCAENIEEMGEATMCPSRELTFQRQICWVEFYPVRITDPTLNYWINLINASLTPSGCGQKFKVKVLARLASSGGSEGRSYPFLSPPASRGGWWPLAYRPLGIILVSVPADCLPVYVSPLHLL